MPIFSEGAINAILLKDMVSGNSSNLVEVIQEKITNI
jgi:hypothetical protein